MKKIFLYLLISGMLVSCTANHADVIPPDPADYYVRFISATNKITTSATTATVTITTETSHWSEIQEAHIYESRNFYQYYIQSGDGVQQTIDRYISPSATSQKYYFKLLLRNGQTINGNIFTVNFQ